MLLRKELLQLCQTVLLAHQEQALPFELLFGSDLSLRLDTDSSCLTLLYFLQAGLGCLQLVENERVLQRGANLTSDATDFEPLVGHLLKSEALQQLVLDEYLLDTSTRCKFYTFSILVSPLDLSFYLVGLAELHDLIHFRVRPVDQHQVLWLRLEHEKLERHTVHAGFHRQVASLALYHNLEAVSFVLKWFAVLLL